MPPSLSQRPCWPGSPTRNFFHLYVRSKTKLAGQGPVPADPSHLLHVPSIVHGSGDHDSVPYGSGSKHSLTNYAISAAPLLLNSTALFWVCGCDGLSNLKSLGCSVTRILSTLSSASSAAGFQDGSLSAVGCVFLLWASINATGPQKAS